MRLALHIFRKDVERLWPVVLVTFALLGLFVAVESGDTRQGTLLDLVLPFAWCLLIGMAIQQDPLVGDRQFWVALPCGWRPLLVSKIAFIVATIELPYFLATALILAIRGFNPFAFVPHLLWKQLVLLALFVPAVALATVAKNIGQFLLIAIATVSGVMFLSDEMNRQSIGLHMFAWDSRWIVALVVLSAGALPVAAIQFVRRRTGPSRGVALATAFAAAGLYHWMSRDASAAVTAAAFPAKNVTGAVRLIEDDIHNSRFHDEERLFFFDRTTARIPIQFSGLPAHGVRHDMITFFITDANGKRYEAQQLDSSDEIRSQRISARLDGESFDGSAIIRVEFYNPAVVSALQRGPITLSGRLMARLYRIGTTVHIANSSEGGSPAIGHCKGGQGMAPQRGYVVVETLSCESPVEDPHNLTMVPDDTPLVFSMGPPSYLGGMRYLPGVLYPQDPWLSPLYRSDGPHEAMNASGWNVTPSTPDGYVTIDYAFPHLDLNQFIVQDPKKEKAQ